MRAFSRFVAWFGIGRIVCIPLLIALVFLRISDPEVLQEVRLRTFDLYQVIKPRERTIRPVVIIDIDEASLKKLGQWPWPRTRIAEMVSKLTEMGAAVIGFDVIFPEPDRLSPAAIADALPNVDNDTREKLKALPSNDEVMANAIRASRVVLGDAGLPTPQAGATTTSAGVASLGGNPTPYLFSFPGLLRNIPVLEKAAAGTGLITIRNEADGIVRRVPMVMMAQGAIVPSLTFAILKVASGSSTVLLRLDPAGIESVGVPGFELPTDRNGQLWVHFARHDPKLYVPAVDLLEGRVADDAIRGKIALIGTSAAGLLDTKTTPLDPVLPGVEVHAQILESALTGSLLSLPAYALGAELSAAIVLCLLLIWLAPLSSPLQLLAVGAVIAAGLVGSSWYLFAHENLLVDFTYPLIASSLIYLTLTFTNYFSEQAQRRRIRSAFGQYLSPALVAQLAQSPDRLVLGGEQRTMSVMFTDVRGFTTISEAYKHNPQGLTSLMNRFLTPLTNAIIDRRGTIDKYMGDAIMAFWNAPLDDADHEVHACEAALDMLDRLERLNHERGKEAERTGEPFFPINIGIGINTGPCVVGNMGSDLRFDYSVLGDSVNLASRIEGQTKSYGVPIIVGSGTAKPVLDRFAILELDYITVKGKAEPEVIYAVCGREDLARSKEFKQWRELHANMLDRYRHQDWDMALAEIERCRTAFPSRNLDVLYTVFIERIAELRANPPPADWDGAYTLMTK